LENLITKCKIRDAWDNKTNANGFTHYTAHGATRIDRIYMSMTLHTRKISTMTLIAFTDHNAVQVKIKENQTPILRGPSKWKLNTSLLCTDES
jgi:endonuclease/exonuclease/phosphatase family metal-dependent hydrolase